MKQFFQGLIVCGLIITAIFWLTPRDTPQTGPSGAATQSADDSKLAHFMVLAARCQDGNRAACRELEFYKRQERR